VDVLRYCLDLYRFKKFLADRTVTQYNRPLSVCL